MNVKTCDQVKNPGDWAFFTDNQERVKLMLPVPVVAEAETEVRVIILPVSGPTGWTWNNDKDRPTLSPSIKTEIVVGYTNDNPSKPIMKEIYHGHLENGQFKFV